MQSLHHHAPTILFIGHYSQTLNQQLQYEISFIYGADNGLTSVSESSINQESARK